MKKAVDEWESYYRDVVPKDAHPTQVIETRRAFYAGAWAALNLFASVGDDSVSEEQGVAFMQWLMAECVEFNHQVKRDLM